MVDYAAFYNEHCIYLPAMLGWFFFSAVLSSYNKLVFGEDHYHFPCPLLMTSFHFLLQYIFACIACMIKPTYFGVYRIQQMTWYEWIIVSVPCGIVTSGDVGLSNLSLVRITITFYTMVKSSTPIFVLIWAYLFGIERITPQLLIVVLIIAIGEYFTVRGEVDFDRTGFFLCLGASMLSGARWTLVQMKLRNLDPPLKTTIATMKLLSPSMFVSLFIVSLIIEEPWIRLAGKSARELVSILGLGVLGAKFAILMILCEFYLIMRANAFVLMIGGVIKEMVSIFIGVMYFKDSLNGTNVSGCFIVFLGVVFYKAIHFVDSQHERRNEMTLVATSDDSDDGEGDNIDKEHERTNGINDCLKPPLSLGSPFTGEKSNYKKLSSSNDILDDSERYNSIELQNGATDGLQLLSNSSHHGGSSSTGTGSRRGNDLRRNRSNDGAASMSNGSNGTSTLSHHHGER